jgi:spermidine/putrescine transport system permease protein
VAITLFSFNDSLYIALPLKSLTLKWYASLSTNTGMLTALKNSLFIGLLASVISTVLGTLAAYAATRHAIPFKGAINGFMMMPMIIPGIVLGVSLLIFFSQIGLGLSLWTVLLGHIVQCVPFALIVMTSRFHDFDRSLEDASRDLGEGALSTFFRITLPLALPGILASLLITFTVSLDEFVVSFFLSSDQVTLPVYIWSQLRFPAKLPGVLALGSILLVATILLVLVAQWIQTLGKYNTSTTARSL